MNIALPSAQRALHFTTADRQLVVTAYTLALGSLLLLGGRLADLFGRKVTFLTGLAGFAGVSAIGGASVSYTMLIAARPARAGSPRCWSGRHIPGRPRQPRSTRKSPESGDSHSPWCPLTSSAPGRKKEHHHGQVSIRLNRRTHA